MLVVPIENAMRGLPDTEAGSVRSDVSVVLKKTTPTCANISLAEKKAVKSLKRAKLMILPADKGRATVVMNQLEYEEKALALLDEDQYNLLAKDQTLTYEKNHFLLQLRCLYTPRQDLLVYMSIRQRNSIFQQFAKDPPSHCFMCWLCLLQFSDVFGSNP
jgi:hypothetical protein